MKTKIENLTDLIKNYYRSIIYLMVPNVCNSKCFYCYIKPKFSQQSVLSKNILRRASKIILAAKSIGFNEFRITGGEPLIFNNISELLSIFKDNKIPYTLFTNGVNIGKYLDFFESNKPKKITISYHSKIYHNAIFGIKYNTDLLDNYIYKLCKMDINLTISILLLEKNKSDIVSHILYLKSLGVKSIKFIYPNQKEIKMGLKETFIDLTNQIMSIKGVELRHSELNTNICDMINRGFLSFPLNKSQIYGCCNSIINKMYISDINNLNDLIKALWNFYKIAQAQKEFPCESYVEFCPIALNE